MARQRPTVGGRYKRIRKRPRGRPNQDVHEYKVEVLGELEKLGEQGVINLFYGDESHVCSEGYVPYGRCAAAMEIPR